MKDITLQYTETELKCFAVEDKNSKQVYFIHATSEDNAINIASFFINSELKARGV